MKIWQELDERLPDLLKKGFDQSFATYLKNSPIKDMLNYHLQGKGKLLRPQLVVGTAIRFGQKQAKQKEPLIEAALPYALAVELIHNATLIHDDLQDEDEVRRGKEALWKKYSAAQAINCGDAWLMIPALELINSAHYSSDLKIDLLKIIQTKTLAVIDGQSKEFVLKSKFLAKDKVSLDDYIQVVSGKTSALFSMPMVGGAKIGGATASDIQIIESAALDLGIAFQIQDDLLDLWGDKGRGFVGGDIAEGKVSYPLLRLAEEMSGQSEFEKVREIISAPREKTTQEQINWVIGVMNDCGIKEIGKKKFNEHIEKAMSASVWDEVVGYIAHKLQLKVGAF
ncbi:MAG: polyprenyl synthetase family protein [Oligoflexia bacterium]|nr:polyprenyl synthetase family protein [Oligoflexia bacterium]